MQQIQPTPACTALMAAVTNIIDIILILRQKHTQSFNDDEKIQDACRHLADMFDDMSEQTGLIELVHHKE